jgi:hypothetical protein
MGRLTSRMKPHPGNVPPRLSEQAGIAMMAR